MNILRVLINKDLLEIIRTKKLIIIIIVFLFVSLSSPITAKLMPELIKSLGSTPSGITINIPTPTYRDALDQYVKNSSQLAVLILLFVVSGAVADEKNKKYLEILISKPVNRTTFILAKFLSNLGVIFMAFLISSLIFLTYTISLFGSFNYTYFFIVDSLIFLYILTILSITISISSIVKNAFWAAGSGIVSIFIFGLIPSLFSKFEKYSPVYIFSTYKNLLENGWNSSLVPEIIVSLVLVTLSVLFAILIFKNQEIE